MRRITRIITEAFLARRPARIDNTYTDGNALYLHGNKIAEWREGAVYITDAGWPTPTTFDRLRGLGANVGTTKGRVMLNNARWNGDWIRL
jgi:hypothetical protein